MLTVILMMISICSCGTARNRVITNIAPGSAAETASIPKEMYAGGTTSVAVQQSGGATSGVTKGINMTDETPENHKDGQNTSTVHNPKEEAGTKLIGVESEGGTGNGKNEEQAVKSADGAPYKGYKGPVQGEIKYKEGTPAGDNSQSLKASGDIDSPYKVNLIVTRDYGHKKIFAKNVGLVRDEVGMEVLFRNLDIQTAYGGGFVNAINGLESQYTFFTGKDRKKLDWFYWVNGILAPVGIAEYRPQPGDVIWWDYHDWSMTMFIPAVVGSYPQPFKSGFGGKNPGTVIMYTDGYKEDAEKLKQSLVDKEVTQVDTAAYDPGVIQQPKKYYILLGQWGKLSENNDHLKDINTKNKLAGIYAKFDDGKLQALDFKGKAVASYEHSGAIYAYGASIGSLNPVWMVTGTDDQGYRLAFDTLLNNPGAINGCFGAAVTKDGVTNVPYGD